MYASTPFSFGLALIIIIALVNRRKVHIRSKCWHCYSLLSLFATRHAMTLDVRRWSARHCCCSRVNDTCCCCRRCRPWTCKGSTTLNQCLFLYWTYSLFFCWYTWCIRRCRRSGSSLLRRQCRCLVCRRQSRRHRVIHLVPRLLLRINIPWRMVNSLSTECQGCCNGSYRTRHVVGRLLWLWRHDDDTLDATSHWTLTCNRIDSH